MGAGLDISSKNSNLMISSGYDDNLVKLWNVVSRNGIQLLRKFKIAADIYCLWFLKFSMDLNFVFTIG